MDSTVDWTIPNWITITLMVVASFVIVGAIMSIMRGGARAPTPAVE